MREKITTIKYDEAQAKIKESLLIRFVKQCFCGNKEKGQEV